MAKIHNKKFENALNGVAQAVPPIWFMRQAGRYHAHYQERRAKHSFMDLCKKPELAAEVALGPVEDFDFDVSILFSDLLFPLESLGMGLDYNPAPSLAWNLDQTTIGKLANPDEAIAGVEFQAEALHKTREVLPDDKSLIGFVGGPWTLFGYAVEGSHKGGLIQTKANLSLWPKFCEKMVPFLKKNIALQLEAGAEIVMIFDTAAGEVHPQVYQRQILPYLEEMAKDFAGRVAYYGKQTTDDHVDNPFFRKGSPLAGLGYDHRYDLTRILKEKKTPGFVQGNFDQGMLFLSHQEFKVELDRYLTQYAKLSEDERAGWVCGLGHGVLPKTPEENVRFFVQRVREFFG